MPRLKLFLLFLLTIALDGPLGALDGVPLNRLSLDMEASIDVFEKQAASAPIYLDTRALQTMRSYLIHDDVPRHSIYGLHTASLMRYAGSVDADSSTCFAVAQTLWSDYYCEFKDSLAANMAFLHSPTHVRREGLITAKAWNAIKEEALMVAGMDAHNRNDGADESQASVAVDLADIPLFVSYVVKTGDSLWKIQRHFPHMHLDALIQANHGKETIYPGQVLMIPL